MATPEQHCLKSSAGRRVRPAIRRLLREFPNVPDDVRIAFFNGETDEITPPRDRAGWMDDLPLLFDSISLVAYVYFPEAPHEAVSFRFPEDYPFSVPRIVTHQDQKVVLENWGPFVHFGHQIELARQHVLLAATDEEQQHEPEKTEERHSTTATTATWFVTNRDSYECILYEGDAPVPIARIIDLACALLSWKLEQNIVLETDKPNSLIYVEHCWIDEEDGGKLYEVRERRH